MSAESWNWQRFCDWLNGPEPEPPPPPKPEAPPEPIRPFVGKLVECIRLGDCKWKPYFYPTSFGIKITFALAEDLSASIDVITFEAYGKNMTPILGSVQVAGHDMNLTSREVRAVMDAYRTASDEKARQDKMAKETAQAQAIAKIEAYTPKAP